MRKVSFVVLVYNMEKHLRKCLDSLVNQSYNDFKIVVVNDGSTDSSLDILEEYNKRYPGMFKIKTTVNQGRSIARNEGINLVKTDFFTFVDSDDYVDKDMLLEFMRAVDKDTDVVVGDCVKVYNGNEFQNISLLNNISSAQSKNLMLSQPSPWGKLFRTSIFKDNNLVFSNDIKLYEDLAVIPRVGMYTDKIKHVEKPLYKYVMHEGSALRQTIFNEKMLDIFKVMDILKKNISDTYHDELEYIYIENLLRTTSLRFIEHKESYQYISKLSQIMKENYPNWSKNKYYKKSNRRFRLVCYLTWHKQIFWLRFFYKLNNVKINKTMKKVK